MLAAGRAYGFFRVNPRLITLYTVRGGQTNHWIGSARRSHLRRPRPTQRAKSGKVKLRSTLASWWTVNKNAPDVEIYFALITERREMFENFVSRLFIVNNAVNGKLEIVECVPLYNTEVALV